MLYIVPTPIGNLADMTLRAIDVLKSVDVILCEDTRTSGRLLKHFEIESKLASYHQHNEHHVVRPLAERLSAGETMALITDAGTPGISDPAFLLVRECIRLGVKVECLPGATAFVPALVNSGLPSNRFCFEGFIPQKKGRQTYLNSIREESRTMVFYESPNRLLRTLTDFIATFGADRKCCVSRELTKLHEENAHGTLAEVLQHFQSKSIKGEIVMVVEGFGRQLDNSESNE